MAHPFYAGFKNSDYEMDLGGNICRYTFPPSCSCRRLLTPIRLDTDNGQDSATKVLYVVDKPYHALYAKPSDI